jgi:hypothetical protein
MSGARKAPLAAEKPRHTRTHPKMHLGPQYIVAGPAAVLMYSM